MIRTQNLVPEYYVEKSRDFQVLCRLYDLAFNNARFNAVTTLNRTSPKNANENILPLMADSLGIHSIKGSSNRDLIAALPVAIKYKGSIKSIKILMNAFLNSEHKFNYAAAVYTQATSSTVYGYELKPYSILLLLDAIPTKDELSVLDEYLKMVVPAGMSVEYATGLTTEIYEKFYFRDDVLFMYTKWNDRNESITNTIRSSTDSFTYAQKPNDSGKYIPKIKSVANTVGVASLRGSDDYNE